jgi:hypothetical protein
MQLWLIPDDHFKAVTIGSWDMARSHLNNPKNFVRCFLSDVVAKSMKGSSPARSKWGLGDAGCPVRRIHRRQLLPPDPAHLQGAPGHFFRAGRHELVTSRHGDCITGVAWSVDE